jgi:hypothetical protein
MVTVSQKNQVTKSNYIAPLALIKGYLRIACRAATVRRRYLKVSKSRNTEEVLRNCFEESRVNCGVSFLLVHGLSLGNELASVSGRHRLQAKADGDWRTSSPNRNTSRWTHARSAAMEILEMTSGVLGSELLEMEGRRPWMSMVRIMLGQASSLEADD